MAQQRWHSKAPNNTILYGIESTSWRSTASTAISNTTTQSTTQISTMQKAPHRTLNTAHSGTAHRSTHSILQHHIDCKARHSTKFVTNRVETTLFFDGRHGSSPCGMRLGVLEHPAPRNDNGHGPRLVHRTRARILHARVQPARMNHSQHSKAQ
jgi:hypothetical protein